MFKTIILTVIAVMIFILPGMIKTELDAQDDRTSVVKVVGPEVGLRLLTPEGGKDEV